jgi:hypothetical protein
VCRGRSNACNPLALRIDKNLGNPVVKKVWVRTLEDHRGIRLLSVNSNCSEDADLNPIWQRTRTTGLFSKPVP